MNPRKPTNHETSPIELLKPIICTEKYFPSLGSLIVATKKIQNGPNIFLFITIFLSKAKENGMMYNTEKEKN